MPPPPTSSQHSPPNASSTSPSSDNPPSSSRLSKDSEGYPSWLPKRPPPPPPASTFQSSMIDGGFHDMTPSPVDAPPFLGGRKPTPRSVRIVSLEDSFVGAVEKQPRFTREPTDQTRVAVHLPPKVLSRASAVPPAAFNASEHDEFLPLPQPRFNAKNLHLQLLRNPTRWMKLYFYVWPLLVLYHIPLQSFFDFNAVFMLIQVSKFPNPQSSGKNWALGAAAYIACWLVWILVICLLYELVYSFARRWRLRRPLMLPIYMSSSAFNYVAMTSYTNFSFLQHVRFSAFFPEPPPTPQSPSDPNYDLDEYYDNSQNPWKSGVAETCFFYAQNLPTVALLLPRAALSMALLFAFSKPPASTNSAVSSFSRRDQTFFKPDGSLTDYARGILFANAAWTAWRLLVLIASWLGLWIVSKQRLAGLCGPRHTWEESDQEKSRSIYSEAVSEYGAYRSSFYNDTAVGGDGGLDYAGDELAWEWREATRMRVQDAFEFCLTSGRGGSGNAGVTGLRWSSVSSGIPYGFGNRNRRYMERHRRRRSAKGKEPSNEKPEFGTGDVATSDEGFEGIEKVLAAVGFPNTVSPSRRGVLSEDLFAAPVSSTLSTQHKQEYPTIEPLRYLHEEPGPSIGMFTGLEPPQMAKRNSRDKVPGSSTVVGGAPLLNLPYPFSKPGTGQVSSNDMILFPVGGTKPDSKKGTGSSESAKSSQSGTSKSKSTTGSSESASGSREGGEDEEDEDEDEEGEEEDEFDSEEPSSEPASGSMSSLGHPISPSRYPFGVRRPGGARHGRSPSGVSSGMSSGAGVSGGSHAHSHSLSSSHGTKSVMGVSMLSQSTGNKESTDSESGAVEGRSLSHGSSPLSGFPLPPRHPHPQGQGRGRSGTAPSSIVASAAAALAGASAMHTTPVAFPTVHQQRRRVDSGRGTTVDPALFYGSDIEGHHELNDDDLDELPDDDDDDDLIDENEDEQGEQEDRVGLLAVPSNPLASHSRTSLSASHSSSSGSGEARSRTHSSFSIHSSRSRHSSTRARSRSRTHSTQGPSVRERASSLGTSMHSLMQSTAASLTQLDLIMRGATGPAAGLGIGSRPRSRVNSSMARLEEDVVFSTSSAPMTEMIERRVSDGSNGSNANNGSVEVVSSPIVGRLRQELEEGYSSGGTHSRSGSESISAENYTFGRPVLFMRPVHEQQHQQQLVEADEDEIVLVERSAKGSPTRSIPTLSMTKDEGGEPKSVSESGSLYSQPLSETTVSPGSGTPIQVPIHHSLSASSLNSGGHSPERQGLAIPWNHQQQGLLAPPLQRREQQPSHDAATISSGSGSPADISTAAESFVTAAPTMEGNTTTTDSSGRRTVSSSWEDGVVIGGVRLSEVGGMVERPGEDMGADSRGWRVV